MLNSDALKDIAATYKYYNFDLTYIDNPFHKGKTIGYSPFRGKAS